MGPQPLDDLLTAQPRAQVEAPPRVRLGDPVEQPRRPARPCRDHTHPYRRGQFTADGGEVLFQMTLVRSDPLRIGQYQLAFVRQPLERRMTAVDQW